MRRADWVAAGFVLATVLASGGVRAADPSAGETDDPDDESSLPEGHPAVDQGNPHADANPHARAGGGGAATPGVFEPPQDVEQEDPSLPAGSIAVDLRDADDLPVRGESINLGIIISSVAKGESRKHEQATTDDQGRAVFRDLEMTSSAAYRVSSGYQGGSFAATPFRIDQGKAMHVKLHVYPVTHDLGQALIVAEAMVAGEVRDDRVQLEEVLTVYNLGRTAWQPVNVHLSLPEGYKALNAQASMSDQGVEEVDGAVRLRGTFGPGRHPIQFTWQLPWSGDRDIDFQVGMPPHVAVARVMMPVASDIQLAVDGFPPAQVRHDAQGQRFLVTERSMRPEDAKLSALAIGIHGLPTVGPDRIVATLLSACGIVTGLVLSLSRRSRGTPGDGKSAKAVRSALLDELAELEVARLAGDVGPKTYERVRRELVDALARTLAPA